MEKNRSYPGYSGSSHAYNYSYTYSRVIGLELEDISTGSGSGSGSGNGNGNGSSYSFNGPSSTFKGSDHPESKRKKRIASYNVLSTEGRLKSTFSNSFKWIKSKLSDFPYSPRNDL